MHQILQMDHSCIRQWSFQPALYLVCGWRKLFQINVWISEFFVDNVYFITLSEQLQSCLVKIWSHKSGQKVLSEFGSLSPHSAHIAIEFLFILWILNWNSQDWRKYLFQTEIVKFCTNFIGRMVGTSWVSSNSSGGDQYWRSWLLRLSGAELQRSPV